jgi:hypothetical protein
MKNIIAFRHSVKTPLWFVVAVLLLTGAVSGNAQKKSSMASKLESKPDAFIQKDFTTIGKVAGVSISVEGITDLGTKTKMNALEMEYSGTDNSTSASVVLDPGEADTLMNFIDFVTNTVFMSGTPPDDREFSYISRSGFEAGCYWSKGWNVYIRVDYKDKRTNVEFNREDVMAFKSLLKQAKSNL